MWIYEKKLEYPVKIKHRNPKLAKIIIEQYGGAGSVWCYGFYSYPCHQLDLTPFGIILFICTQLLLIFRAF